MRALAFLPVQKQQPWRFITYVSSLRVRALRVWRPPHRPSDERQYEAIYAHRTRVHRSYHCLAPPDRYGDQKVQAQVTEAADCRTQ